MRLIAFIAHATATAVRITLGVLLAAVFPVAVLAAFFTWSFDPIAIAIVFGLGLAVITTAVIEAIDRLDEWADSILSVPTSAPSASGPFSGGS